MSARKSTSRTSSKSFMIKHDGKIIMFWIESSRCIGKIPVRSTFRAAAARFVKSGKAEHKGYDIYKIDDNWHFDVAVN